VTWSNHQTINMASSTKNPSYNQGKKSLKQKHSPDETEVKRAKVNSSSRDDTSSAIADVEQSEHWPKFLIIQGVDNGEERNSALAKLSPFVIEKTIQGCIGSAVQIKKLRSGQLLVEVSRRTQAENLLKLTQFASLPVSVSPHRGLNTCRGVIRSSELAGMDPDELVTELKKFHVSKADRIFITKNNERKPTNTLILTFNIPTLPTFLAVAYLHIKVEPYIPSPLRCYRCQRYGHHQGTCKRNPACFKCGSTEHNHTNCSNTPKCLSCEGEHPANFSRCPVWLREKEICKIKVLEKLSYPEARARVEGMQPTAGTSRSYASALASKPKMYSVSTQTEVTGCKCIPNFIESQNVQATRSTSTSDLYQIIDKSAQSVSTAARGGPQTTPLAGTDRGRGRSLSPRLGDRSAQSISPRAPPRERREEGTVLQASQPGAATSRQGGAAPQQIGTTRKGGSTEPTKQGKPPFKPVEAPSTTKSNNE
jgi:hypothetical protein